MTITATIPPKSELTAFFLERGYGLDYLPKSGKNLYVNPLLMENYHRDPGLALLLFGFDQPSPDMSPGLAYLHSISRRFIRRLTENAEVAISPASIALAPEQLWELSQQVPYALGVEHVDAPWLTHLWEMLFAAYQGEAAQYDTVTDFLLAQDPNLILYGRVYFHLVESGSEEYPFAFLATYSTTAETPGQPSHLPLKNALLEYQGQREALLRLLATVSRAVDRSDFISQLVESGEIFSPLKFSEAEAYTFLLEIPLYEECGIICRIPDWWRKKYSTPRVAVTIGERPPSQLGLEALLSFDPSIYLGDVQLDREEIEALLAQTAGLSFIKGKWIEVNHEKLRAVLTAYDAAAGKDYLSFGELIRLQLATAATTEESDSVVVQEITNGEWLSNLRNQLLSPELLSDLPLDADFQATLRHYQQKGAGWLNTMRSLGFGALLADDMGLGKTVQILALLEFLRQQHTGAVSLLIIPASLLGNWEKEIGRFTPKLRYTILHNKDNTYSPQEVDLVITTYGMTLRLTALCQQEWDLVILDEAQAIKNPSTKQSKTVKQLNSRNRIAMTGTPIENNLTDLWSLFDFLNPGLLGTAKEFSTFVRSLQKKENYARLREVVSPFILRRLKTDKSIIADLPDKIEAKAYAGLTKKQVVLYNGLVKDIARLLETTEGIQRKGVVLASLIKFKQICNHPDQYLGVTGFKAEHSGKFAKLLELCETIREKRERVLIFTQFREITEPLAQLLADFWQRPGLVLHGGTPVKKRAQLVEQFCGRDYLPFMVLSIKAGGLGLNLTAANHVIHFDRWWNPAVENQATDRAFRIGQEKNVLVHKMITIGTIEEKIDAMIEEKQQLAQDIITDTRGEGWITELDNRQLLELFTLR